MPVHAVPKPAPRVMEKAKRLAQNKSAERECYQQVDRRDERQCRVCKRRVGGVSMVDALHHHHLTPRSRGGEHTTANVITLCASCHVKEHAAEMRLTGNADLRNSLGKLNGVLLERATAAGWRIERWV